MKAPVCLCLCRGRGFTLLTICHACVLCFPLCSISLTTCVNTLYRVLRSPSAEEFIQLWPVLTSGPVSQTQLRPHQLPLFSITTSTPSSTCSCPKTASVFKLKNPPNIYLKPWRWKRWMNEQVSCFGLFVCSLWPCRHIGLKYKKYCSQWNLMRSGDVRQLQWDDGIGEFFVSMGVTWGWMRAFFQQTLNVYWDTKIYQTSSKHVSYTDSYTIIT